jgi:ABC-2 type transport system ATP-binding protein
VPEPAPDGPGAPAGAPIEVAGLTKRFGSLTAVDGLSFTVGPGQVVGLLGPNGAGKTTTLRMIVGLVSPTAGSVRLFGEPVHPGSPQLERAGVMVEGPGFVPHLTGRRNLELYWRAGGRKKSEADWERALAAAALGTAIDAKYKTYSHGMRQRLALGQALLGRPQLLILDEPVNGLDPQQIATVRNILHHLAREGTTVLLSSHLLAEVEMTCTHVVVMDHGRLVRAGTLEQVRGIGTTVYLEVDDPVRALDVLARLPGVRNPYPQPPGIVVEVADGSRRALVAALVGAGVGVETVVVRGGLEQAYLDLLAPAGAAGAAANPAAAGTRGGAFT